MSTPTIPAIPAVSTEAAAGEHTPHERAGVQDSQVRELRTQNTLLDLTVQRLTATADGQRWEIRARVDQESDLRAHLEELAADNTTMAAKLAATELAVAEARVAYAELLCRARAEVAEQRTGTPFRAGHLAGHLEELGLEPPAGAVPEHLVAEGIALAERLTDRLTDRFAARLADRLADRTDCLEDEAAAIGEGAA